LIPTLWYENESGERWVPVTDADWDSGPPSGYRYQHSRLPFSLRHTVVICNADGSSSVLMAGEQSGPADLMLAVARPSLWQRVRQVALYGWPARTLPPKQAYLVACVSCEACMNELAHRHGLSWGYRRGSQESKSANTTCELCLRVLLIASPESRVRKETA